MAQVRVPKSRFTHAHPAVSRPGSAKKMERQPKKGKKGGADGEGWFLPHPLPALLFVPFFTWSLNLAPRSLLRNRTETLATLFTSCYGQLIALIFGPTLYVFFFDRLSRCGSTDTLIYCMPVFKLILSLFIITLELISLQSRENPFQVNMTYYITVKLLCNVPFVLHKRSCI